MRVRAVARRQHGLVTRDQARSLGVTDSAVERRIAAGLWERLHPHVFRIAGVPDSRHQRLMAAALWAGELAVVSHESAGWLWGLDGVRARDPELWVWHERAPTSEGVRTHRTQELREVDRAFADAIRVTAPARTIVDLASVLRPWALEQALESALRHDIITVQDVDDRLADIGGRGRRGTRVLRTVLMQRGGAAPLESALEVRVERILRSYGLPTPIRQHEVRAGSHVIARLDFAYPDDRVAIEADGYSVHGGRIAFHRDRRRLAQLAARGWKVVPVTWEDCSERPTVFVAAVRAALDGAA